MTLWIHGMGHAHPENEISNSLLEELDLGVDDAWIVQHTGIRSRRTVLPLDYLRSTRNRDPAEALDATPEAVARLGAQAARRALARAGRDASEVGLLLAGTSAGDLAGPATACAIGRELELEIPALDINSACTSFFASLWTLARMRPEHLPELVLVVAAEALTRTVDYRQASAAVLLGDAAAAAVVSPREAGPAAIRDLRLDSSPAGSNRARIPRTGFFWQDGRGVQWFAIKRSSQQLERLRDRHETPERTMHFIGHQANLRMLESVCRQASFPESRHHSNVEWFGNTGGASAPSVLSQTWSKWSGEDDVAFVGVGAGLTWSSALVRFQ